MSARPPHELLDGAEPATAISKLVPVGMTAIGGELVQSVNAGDLHAYMEVKSAFRNWIKNRITGFGFTENQDFVTTVEIYRGGEAKEYSITLDMAKELAMVERNAKGKEARLYFIDCERRALAALKAPALPNFADPAAAARAWADEVEEKRAFAARADRAENKLADQAPAVAGFDRIANASGTNTLSMAAKLLQLQPGQLIDWLLEKKWIFKRKSKSGNSWYIAYQDRLDPKYLAHKFHDYPDPETGEWKVKEQVLVTRKGVAKLAELFAVEAMTARLAAEPVQLQQRLPLPGDDG